MKIEEDLQAARTPGLNHGSTQISFRVAAASGCAELGAVTADHLENADEAQLRCSLGLVCNGADTGIVLLTGSQRIRMRAMMIEAGRRGLGTDSPRIVTTSSMQSSALARDPCHAPRAVVAATNQRRTALGWATNGSLEAGKGPILDHDW